MQPNLHFQKEIARALREDLIPWVRDGKSRLALGAPPFQVPTGLDVRPEDIPLLKEPKTNTSFIDVGGWPDAGLVMARYPVLLIVLEGEADLRFGLTTRMAAGTGLSQEHGCYVYSLPRRSIVAIPPGVPRSDSSRPHWERKNLEEARSRLLWIHILPAGLSLHTCSSEGARHTSSPGLFVNDPKSDVIVQSLLEEMAAKGLHHEELAQAALLSLLLRIDRQMTRSHVLSTEEERRYSPGEKAVESAGDPIARMPVQRACRFIEAHLTERLTPQLIASHAYISVPHLNRMFHAELGKTVMKYVQERRLETARSLLRETDLPIHRVSTVSGFLHHAHFCRVFLEQTGTSPVEYRRRQRSHRTSAKRRVKTASPKSK